MKKKAIYLLLATATLSLGACSIDRDPYGQMSTSQVQGDPNASLDALLNGTYAQLKAWSDPMHRCGEYAGDNMMIRGSSTDSFYEFISFARTPNNGRLQSFWDNAYKAIAQSSNIINMIPEGKDASINNKLGECYYIRGLMYFYLVRAYGRPYYQAPERNLGVPIVNGTPANVSSDMLFDDRATVAATYQQVISDLKKAELLLTESKGASYASKGAAQALLSRVYLYMSGTYESPNREYAEQAVAYASKVIESGAYALLSRDEFMKYPTFSPDNNKESIFVVRRRASEYSGWDHYYGIGGMYSNIGRMGWGEMFASAKYIALLNETGRNDWRPDHRRIVDARAAFIEPQYILTDGKYETVFRFIHQDAKALSHYEQFTIVDPTASTLRAKDTKSGTEYPLTAVDADQDIYSIEFNGKTYEGFIDYRIKLNRAYPEFYITKCSRETEESQLHSPVISRLGEIYLNRAEAYAKLGNYAAALQDLNTIRERSIVGGGYASLSSTDAPERIDKERQLELAYQAERSYDVFRNGKSLERRYPGPHAQTEVVPATDYRVVFFIPQRAITAYPGKLTQNPTSNS